jgi:hypothetical protein
VKWTLAMQARYRDLLLPSTHRGFGYLECAANFIFLTDKAHAEQQGFCRAWQSMPKLRFDKFLFL